MLKYFQSTDMVNPLALLTLATTIAVGLGALQNKLSEFSNLGAIVPAAIKKNALDKNMLAVALGRRQISDAILKTPQVVQLNGEELDVKYSIDARLQQTVEATLKAGKLAYGAFVAIDPKTGQVLAMASLGQGALKTENLNLRASYPAASVFKIITAASAIETGRLQHNSMIPVLGSFHTLYKRNVLSGGGIDPGTTPRYARLISFEDALAKSVNSVFGKVGIFGVGPEGLRKTADRFLFGRPIPFELPVEESVATIPDDKFGLAESASGFTRHNTMSPVHGALIASAIVNDGIIMEPSIVQSVQRKDGKVMYEFEPKVLATSADKFTADQLTAMMHRTITNGTSRGAFRGANRSIALSEVFIGGKTGTLNGSSPAGRYDWFVGFAENGNQKIAVAALCIHGTLRGIKASRVARTAIEAYFNPVVAVR